MTSHNYKNMTVDTEHDQKWNEEHDGETIPEFAHHQKPADKICSINIENTKY